MPPSANNHLELFKAFIDAQKYIIWEGSGTISKDLRELHEWAVIYAREQLGLDFVSLGLFDDEEYQSMNEYQ